MKATHVPSFEVIERWIKDEDPDIRIAAINACQGREVPLEIIEQGLKDEDWRIRVAAINACQGREVPLEIIEQGLKDEDPDIRIAAMSACQGREVPLKIIEQGLKDKNWHIRVAAMNACQGREVPFEVIEQGLKDKYYAVRVAAINACRANEIAIPIIRAFEPPELVYKMCLGNVIVVAEIPKDAQVRGSIGHKCRANKAVIKNIIGDLYGEPVGVSEYDLKTFYYVGDEVEIDDFDYSDEECSTGFHFFNTIEEAREYV